MTEKYVKIPYAYTVGGQHIRVRKVERCEDNKLGLCCVSGGYVEIAEKVNKDVIQTESSCMNTFYHELTHSILDTMGEYDLSNNEKFVCTFSSFLTEAMKMAYFKVD